MLIFDERQLVHVLAEYETHYNTHRPHRALEQRPPIADVGIDVLTAPARSGGPRSSVV